MLPTTFLHLVLFLLVWWFLVVLVSLASLFVVVCASFFLPFPCSTAARVAFRVSQV